MASNVDHWDKRKTAPKGRPPQLRKVRLRCQTNSSTQPPAPRKASLPRRTGTAPESDTFASSTTRTHPKSASFLLEFQFASQTGAFGVRVLVHPPSDHTTLPRFKLPRVLKTRLREMAQDGEIASLRLLLRVDRTRESRASWAAAVNQAVTSLRNGAPGNTSPSRHRRNVKWDLRQRDAWREGSVLAV